MEWLVAVVLAGLGVALVVAGVHNSAPELFGSIFTAGAPATLPGSGKVTVPSAGVPANSDAGAAGRRPRR